MSCQIRLAFDFIKQGVPQTEASIEQALVSFTNLLAALVQECLDSGVPAARGQIAVGRLAKAQMTLVEASHDVFRMHGDLGKVGQAFAAFDVHEDCPPAHASQRRDGWHSVAACLIKG